MSTRNASKRAAKAPPARRPCARTASTPPESAPSYEERYAAGKALRDRVPREAHGDWRPPQQRRDPVDLARSRARGAGPWHRGVAAPLRAAGRRPLDDCPFLGRPG